MAVANIFMLDKAPSVNLVLFEMPTGLKTRL